MPGPPPRQHKHERQYTPSTHSVIPIRRIWNDDDDGQMIFGDPGGLKFPDICLTGEEKPRKNLTQETCPNRGSNSCPLRDKRTCYHLLYSGGHILRLPLLTYAQSIGDQHPTGKHGVELCCSPRGSYSTEVVLNGIPVFSELLTHHATVRYGSSTSPHASHSH